MRPAKTLRELLSVRRQNAAALCRIDGYLGSAIGYKWSEGGFERDTSGALVPAVLIFVSQKKDPADVAPGQLVPPTLSGPNDLGCVTDVVTGRMPNNVPSAPPLSADNKKILNLLHDGSPGVVGGMALRANNVVGTAACVVRHTLTQKLGLLTNWHVSGNAGTQIGSFITGLPVLGVTRQAVLMAPKTAGDLNDLESFVGVKHRLDCAYIELQPAAAQLAQGGVFGVPKLGPLYVNDLDSLGVLGLKVRGLGQTRGWESGTIIAYGYEWQDEENPGAQFATNYLIMGEPNQPFAGPGDSGKLVLTDDGLNRPIALLWGGERQQFWGTGKAQDSWAYASDLSQALNLLGVELLPSGGS
jgi:hypothetical protein